jgi:hypothetical protein
MKKIKKGICAEGRKKNKKRTFNKRRARNIACKKKKS